MQRHHLARSHCSPIMVYVSHGQCPSGELRVDRRRAFTPRIPNCSAAHSYKNAYDVPLTVAQPLTLLLAMKLVFAYILLLTAGVQASIPLVCCVSASACDAAMTKRFEARGIARPELDCCCASGVRGCALCVRRSLRFTRHLCTRTHFAS